MKLFTILKNHKFKLIQQKANSAHKPSLLRGQKALRRRKGYKNILTTSTAIFFWLAVWFVAGIAVNNNLVLASPIEVFKTLLSNAFTMQFWGTVFYSFRSIISGFFVALITASVLAGAAFRIKWIKHILSPLTSIIKATPVASFIILALFWVGSKNLSAFTSFLMVLPIIYTNILQGFLQADKELVEMAQVFRINTIRKLLYIYLPSIKPYIISACSASLGMCWKAGVAAEVIGQPKGSMGEQLYYSKLYFDTAGLFAWTITIIAVSCVFEKIFICLLKRLLYKTG